MKALVLLSGGQDSATCLAWAKQRYDVQALSFFYRQRHCVELDEARYFVEKFKVELHRTINISSCFSEGESALLDLEKELSPKGGYDNLPTSYILGRNIVFLSIAMSFAAERGVSVVIIGASEADYSGYPDCRRVFFDQFQKAFNLGIGREAPDTREIQILTPLIHLTKCGIWKLAEHLGILDDVIQHTMTCYAGRAWMNPWGKGCGKCPACILRKRGWDEFQESKRGN